VPKVSEEYLAARRRHILESARRSFVRNGFHATSMQDLFADSGLSAGVFYRYFDSKGSIVAAIAQESMSDVIDALTSVVAETDGGGIGEALARAMEVLMAKDDVELVANLAVQGWGEALRDPVFAVQLRELLDGSRLALSRVIRRQQRAGRLPAGIKAESLVSVFFMLLPGFLLQRALLGPESVAGSPAAARALWPGA
jgi:TetR/AcrR family transcriptional regulator, transcriptional repressor of aconitase